MGQLRSATLKSPGGYGLNLADDIANDQSYRFLGAATNGVVDVDGKLCARQNFVNQTTGLTATVAQVYMHRHLDGTETVISAGSTGKIYTGLATVTERYDDAGSANNWQFASLNGKLFCAQTGCTFYAMTEGSTWASASVTEPTAAWGSTKGPDCCIAAYGRLWAAGATDSKHTVWWSKLLDGVAWTTGDAGSLDVDNAWPVGRDSITALCAAFGRLIIFGRNAILMYTLPEDNNPADMTLTDVVNGIGCVARDSVIAAADGVYFLSDNGVYKIDRLAQVTSLMSSLPQSALANEEMLTTIAGETLAQVRAGYYPLQGWYVLACPTANKTYVFHTRQLIPQVNLPPVTVWTNTGNAYRGFTITKEGYWYCAATDGIYKYGGYTAVSGNNAYSFAPYVQWLDLGEVSRLKHLKYCILTLEAKSGQTGTVNWQMDYKAGTTRTASFTCNAVEFAENPGLGDVKVPLGGSCNAVKLGFSITVTQAVKLHAITLGSLVGKTAARP